MDYKNNINSCISILVCENFWFKIFLKIIWIIFFAKCRSWIDYETCKNVYCKLYYETFSSTYSCLYNSCIYDGWNKVVWSSLSVISWELYYSENPLSICSIYIHDLKTYFIIINDPLAKIIHIITNEKYLKSHRLIAYAFSYIKETNELMFISNNGLYSINITEQRNFFSKFMWK